MAAPAGQHSAKLARGFERHKAGDRAVSKAQPGNADALYLTGVPCLAERHLLLPPVRAIFPSMTALSTVNKLLNGALAMLRAGDLAAAEAGLRAVLEADPDHPDGLVLLGDLQRQTNRAAEGVTSIARAIRTAPGRGRKPDPAWTVMLAMAKRDSGDMEGALADLEGLMRMAKANADLLILKGGLLQRLDRHLEAVRVFYEAHGLRVADASILNSLGVSLQACGRHKDALKAFHRAVALDPGLVSAAVNAGKLLRDGGQFDDAIAMLRKASGTRQGASAVAMEIALADVLSAAGRSQEAAAIVERLCETNPGNPAVLVKRGEQLLERGDKAAAREMVLRALRIDEAVAGGAELLAELGGGDDPSGLLARIEARLAVDGNQIGRHFAAAGLCEKLGRHVDAFSHYAAGNANRKAVVAAMDKGYDRRKFERDVDETIAAFGEYPRDGWEGSDSELPVFVVGMPRSGTTLSEQIVASHPLAAGAGELFEIGDIARWLRQQPGHPQRIPAAATTQAALGYLRHIQAIGKGALRVVDKMPSNFMYLGLIARLFPRARIIHCRRDPMDNLLSCFSQNFSSNMLAWSCDLEDMAHQYGQYRKIMDHWRLALPAGTMLEIDYEDTVADLEAQARRMIEFLGLPWNDACLRFHESTKDIKTASRLQVKQPIYNSSVGRWKRYGDGVLPLVRALAEQGIAVEA